MSASDELISEGTRSASLSRALDGGVGSPGGVGGERPLAACGGAAFATVSRAARTSSADGKMGRPAFPATACGAGVLGGTLGGAARDAAGQCSLVLQLAAEGPSGHRHVRAPPPSRRTRGLPGERRAGSRTCGRSDVSVRIEGKPDDLPALEVCGDKSARPGLPEEPCPLQTLKPVDVGVFWSAPTLDGPRLIGAAAPPEGGDLGPSEMRSKAGSSSSSSSGSPSPSGQPPQFILYSKPPLLHVDLGGDLQDRA